jgi:hypothetical protein
MSDSLTDSFLVKGTQVLVGDKMQRSYRYRRTETPGKNFAPDFVPEPTPRQMLALGVFGGKIHDRLYRRITRQLIHSRQALAAGQNTAA